MFVVKKFKDGPENWNITAQSEVLIFLTADLKAHSRDRELNQASVLRLEISALNLRSRRARPGSPDEDEKKNQAGASWRAGIKEEEESAEG